jgi:hypothetical protein
VGILGPWFHSPIIITVVLGTFLVKPFEHVGLYIDMAEGSSATMQPKGCREHQVLYGRMKADTRVYIDATKRLDSCKPEDFEKTYQAAESARIAFLKAREALNSHITLHKCER